jgi:hypothetical protein
MPKKKRSQKMSSCKQVVNNSKRNITESGSSLSARIMRFLLNQLVSMIIKSIFEEHIKALKLWLWGLVKELVCWLICW